MYVELHCHSAYSFLDGASLPEELVVRADQLGMKALALTDHDGLYGSMIFAQAAKAWGIQPITGSEVTLEDGSHLTLLVESEKGYANLCRLLSEAHLAGEKGSPRLAWSVLAGHAEGLILLSGCRQSALATHVDANAMEDAYRLLGRYKELFGPDRLWVELQQNFVQGDTVRIKRLLDLSRRAGVPVVATNNVHYHVRARHRLQDVLVAIKHRKSLDASHKERRANSEFYLKSPEEMAALFAEVPQAVRATQAIAERCAAFDLTQDLGYTFPDFSDADKGESAAERLARLCHEALKERYGDADPAIRRQAQERLDQELRLVEKHGLCGFFLVYRDLMQLAQEVADEVREASAARQKAHLPPGRGRGSSVSSLICYLIGLSHVDPIQAKLSIDRFLTEESQTIPDIDLDFARDIRERLILRVYEHYGREHAALVCSFSTYRLRSAVRDVGKALGLPTAEVDRLAKLSERGSAALLRESMEALPEFKDRVDAPLWRELVELAGEIAGFPRHISQHVGGMIISSRPLVECVPIEKARMPGRIVCQWDKESCEDAGFIKVDFLALGMLSLVEECVEQIASYSGETIDLSRIPFDDEAVYDQICRGDTVGVFQIESRAQIQMLPRTQPRNLEELAIEVAIIRPGPIVGGAVHPYVERRTAQRKAALKGESYTVTYDHPLLERALKETLGVILYQDQVIHVAVDLAGFTPGQAEQLRRALGRKRSLEAVAHFRKAFCDGAVSKGVPLETAELVFERILAFSQFGFPKSHSFAFAVLAYQSAWLRHYYPAAYAAALFNSQPMGFYPPHVIVHDAVRHGVKVLPPCINQSDVTCSAGPTWVRIGLNYVKGLGKEDAEHIVKVRQKEGPFTTLDDFERRVGLSSKKMEALILAGLFDAWGKGRRELLWELGLNVPEGGKSQEPRQMKLPLRPASPPVDLPPLDQWALTAADYKATGLSARAHFLEVLRPQMPQKILSVKQIEEASDGTRAYVAGLVVARQRPETARGVIFLLLHDETGLLNVVVRPDLYEKRRPIVRGEGFLTVLGKVQRQEGSASLLAYDVWPLQHFVDLRAYAPLGSAQPASHDFH